MRKTSVAIILHGLSRNGIDMLMASLAKYWDYSRFDVTYLLGVDPGAPQPAEDEVTAAGARVIHLHDLDRGRWCLWPVTLRRALPAPAHRPDRCIAKRGPAPRASLF